MVGPSPTMNRSRCRVGLIDDRLVTGLGLKAIKQEKNNH